jgi:hypothetical protein
MAQYLVAEMIFALMINQIKLIHMQILENHLFIRIMLRIINKHG